MPPPTILNPTEIDWSRVLYARDEIYRAIPQRHEFSQLDAVVHVDTDAGVAAAYRDVRADEWWCRGHLPERPIFPGVLMIESAAQLAAFYRSIVMPDETEFMGFGGIDRVKFRGAVLPPSRILFTGRAVEMRRRRFVCDVQAHVDGAMVFEGTITGLPMRL